MPPARRRSGAKQEAANTAVEDTTTEAEATEGDEEGEEDAKPKVPRVKKSYTVQTGRAELANSLVGEDFPELNEGDPATGEILEEMRSENGVKGKWDSPEEGSIKYVFGSNSAIPLRNMLNRYLAEQDEDQVTLEDVDELYALLIGGEGWESLAARTGATKDAVKEALKDKVMEEQDADVTDGGRAYGKGESWRWVTADELIAAKESNGNGEDAEEGDEEGEEDDANDTAAEDTGDEEEAPAPSKRRRRTAPAA